MVQSVNEFLNASGASIVLPDFNALTGILYFVGAMVIALILGFIIFWNVKQKKEFKYVVDFYIDYNSRIVKERSFKAKEFLLDNSIVCLYLKENKQIIPFPKMLSGHRTFSVLKMSNNRYKNFVIPAKFNGQRITEIEMDKTDLDYQNLVIKDNEALYKKKLEPFWQKYGQTISILVLILVFGGAFYFLLQAIIGVMAEMGGMVSNMADIVKEINLGKGINSTAEVVKLE